jgi:hypothetical protein
MNMAPIRAPKHDDAGAGGDPERPPAGDGEVVEGLLGAALLNHERDQRGDGEDGQADHERPGVGHGGEVDSQDERADEDR